MLWNIIIVVILLFGFICAIKKSKKQITNPCDGCSECTPIKMQEKKLTGTIVMTKTFFIHDMTCPHCYEIVESSINQINGLSAKVNSKKNEIIIKGLHIFTDEEIEQALSTHGFKCTRVDESTTTKTFL